MASLGQSARKPQLKLLANDGKVFTADKAMMARMSSVIRDLLEATKRMGISDEEDDEPLPLTTTDDEPLPLTTTDDEPLAPTTTDDKPSPRTKDDEDDPLPLFNIDRNTLELVLQWCKYHTDDPPEPEDAATECDTEDICSWDKELLNAPLPVIFEIVKAANYLNIQGLIRVCCKTLANMIKDKSVEDIREIMGIKNDFSPEHEEEVVKELKWCQGLISDSASSRPSRS